MLCFNFGSMLCILKSLQNPLEKKAVQPRLSPNYLTIEFFDIKCANLYLNQNTLWEILKCKSFALLYLAGMDNDYFSFNITISFKYSIIRLLIL